LCNDEEETSVHLILQCPFARVVWERIGVWTGGLILHQVPEQKAEVEDWWKVALANLPNQLEEPKQQEY